LGKIEDMLWYPIVRDQKIFFVKARQWSSSISDLGIHVNQRHAGAKCRRFLSTTEDDPEEARGQSTQDHSSRISKTRSMTLI
jgi:hypothetical protein